MRFGLFLLLIRRANLAPILGTRHLFPVEDLRGSRADDE